MGYENSKHTFVRLTWPDNADGEVFEDRGYESARAKEQQEAAFVGNSRKIGRGGLSARFIPPGGAAWACLRKKRHHHTSQRAAPN